MIWVCRAAREVRAALPASLRSWRPLLLVTSLVHYDQTPVGAYDEVVASVILLRGRHWVAHVPFIAVDSEASIVGGRVNWALPKTMAAFEGRPAAGATTDRARRRLVGERDRLGRRSAAAIPHRHPAPPGGVRRPGVGRGPDARAGTAGQGAGRGRGVGEPAPVAAVRHLPRVRRRAGEGTFL